jgi:hypothetical protein
MIRTGGNQQRDRHGHQRQARHRGMPRQRRQLVESVAEHLAQLKPQQDLGTEDQHPGLVETDFDFLGEFHAFAKAVDSESRG